MIGMLLVSMAGFLEEDTAAVLYYYGFHVSVFRFCRGICFDFYFIRFMFMPFFKYSLGYTQKLQGIVKRDMIDFVFQKI
jgi:hypothetical protein